MRNSTIRNFGRLIAFILVGFGIPLQADTLRMAVTSSFANSGLADVLLPAFTADSGIDVELLITGTGQALKLGENGDVDAVFVHSKPDEIAFVAAGFATHRVEIMYNDFVVIGPNDDPAQIRDAESARTAFTAIAKAQALFVSRGDNSGTHKKELSIWDVAHVEPNTVWYREAGQGMGATLNMAVGLSAYALTDRASWLNFGNPSDMVIAFEGDPELFNQYAYMPISQTRHAHINIAQTQAFEDWLLSPQATSIINAYAINGQRLFTYNARDGVLAD